LGLFYESVVSTTGPLAGSERSVFLAAVRAHVEDPAAQTAWVIYSTGCHPWSLANPRIAEWSVTQDEGGTPFIDWRLPKTRPFSRRKKTLLSVDGTVETYDVRTVRASSGRKQRTVHLRLNPEIGPFIEEFLRTQLGFSEEEYRLRVVNFGRKVGLSGLSPRTLRHDHCLRMCVACEWDLNRARLLTGTTELVLLGYTRFRDFGDLDPSRMFG